MTELETNAVFSDVVAGIPIPCPEIVAGTAAAVWMPPKRRVPVQRLRL